MLGAVVSRNQIEMFSGQQESLELLREGASIVLWKTEVGLQCPPAECHPGVQGPRLEAPGGFLASLSLQEVGRRLSALAQC